MPAMKRSTHYNMNHQRRGVAIIFNHENFNCADLKSRTGTNVDCHCIAERLNVLNFDVEVHNDLNYKDLINVIERSKYGIKFYIQ